METKGSWEDRAQARAESKLLGLDFDTGKPIEKQEASTPKKPQRERLENNSDR